MVYGDAQLEAIASIARRYLVLILATVGVVVTEVDPNGPAAETGIEPGDVILKIGDSDVKSAKDLRQALSDTSARGRDKALALVKRGDGQRYVALPAKSLS